MTSLTLYMCVVFT